MGLPGGPVRRDRRSRRCRCRPEGHGARRARPVQRVPHRRPARRPTVPRRPARPVGDSMTYSNVSVDVRLPLAGRAAPEGGDGHGRPCRAGCCPAGTTIELNRDEYVQPGPLERAQTVADPQRIRTTREPVLTVDQIQETRTVRRSPPRPTTLTVGGAAMTEIAVPVGGRPSDVRFDQPRDRRARRPLRRRRPVIVTTTGRPTWRRSPPARSATSPTGPNRVKVFRDHRPERAVGKCRSRSTPTAPTGCGHVAHRPDRRSATKRWRSPPTACSTCRSGSRPRRRNVDDRTGRR